MNDAEKEHDFWEGKAAHSEYVAIEAIGPDPSAWDGLNIPEFFVNRHIGTVHLGGCVKLYFGLAMPGRELMLPSYAAIWQVHDLHAEAAKLIRTMTPAHMSS